jgi:hypothetical protein
MFGQTAETHPTRFQMNEEENAVGGEASPGEHFNCEKVGTSQDGNVGGDEILPRSVLAALGCGLDSISSQDIAHGLIGNRVAEIGKGPDDAVVSPTGVFPGEADNERFEVGRDAGPGEVRNWEPSNLRATSPRYQARMVSGLATQATC